MKKKYLLLFLVFFFIIFTNLNASSKYIKVGCKECESNCYILNGEYETSISNNEEYNSISIPSGFSIYDGSKKITSNKIYYKNDSGLLFGCKDDNNDNDNDTTNNSNNKSTNDGEIDVKVGDTLTCEEILGNNGKTLVKIFIIAIRILAPILMIVLSSYDFMISIPNKDPDEMFKAWKRVETRAIVVALIMLLPTLLNVISKLFGIFDSCSIW